ncbi:MAG: tetratricopeptide repeat protein [Planctomycetota bacterium]
MSGSILSLATGRRGSHGSAGRHGSGLSQVRRNVGSRALSHGYRGSSYSHGRHGISSLFCRTPRIGIGHHSYSRHHGHGSHYFSRHHYGHHRHRYRRSYISLGFGFCSSYPVYSPYYSSYPVYTYSALYPYYTSPGYVYTQPSYSQNVYIDGSGGEQYRVEGDVSGDNNVQAPADQQGEGGLNGVVIPEGDDGQFKNTRLPEEQLHRLMLEGIEAFSAGKYEKAAERFLMVAMEDRDNPDALLAFAIARFATEDYRISAVAIRRGISQFPEIVNSAFNILGRYGDKDDFEDHLEELVEYVEDHEDDVDGRLVLGFVQHFMYDRESAAKTFALLKLQSSSDADLADLFIKARPLKEVLAELEKEISAERERALAATTQPAGE